MLANNWQRSVRLDGCLNFRDLGGYRNRHGQVVRTGQVFRSDALHRLSVQDVARLRHELRITDILDLRSSTEVRTDGRGLLEREPVGYHHVPLFDGETSGEIAAELTLADRYLLLAEFGKRRIGRVLNALAEAAGPAVYHCAAGKDRTGVISALLLGLLDVEDDVIVADYALTQENLDQIIARLLVTEGYRTMLEALPPDTLHADPETMRVFLAGIRTKYGSLQDYGRAAGVTNDGLQQLQDRLL